MSLPDSHPMHLGFEPSPLLEEADVVLVVDALVPWLPDETGPRKDAKIIHMAPDPLFGNLPMRTFPCDIAITTSGLAGLTALDAALTEHEKAAKSRIDRRRGALAERRAAQRAHLQSVLERARSQTPISPAWLTHCIGEIKGADAIVVNEARMPVPFMPIEQPGTYINAGHAGGLGWGLGTAIGAKMAAGDRMVIATEGDGAYMFSNPVPAHYVAYEQNAPILTVIYNNRRWGAVREAAVGLYPDGHVSQSNAPPLINFDPGLKLAKTVDVVDGHGEQVTEPDQVMPALERAVRAVTEDKRQALLDVVCA
jgi:acetolactate synthase-1/2/3 large subunit